MNGLVPGRIVYFVVDALNAEAIARRRTTSQSILERLQATPPTWPAGAQAHMGNTVAEGDILPAMVVQVWGQECVNLRVMLDGTDELWVTSAMFDGGTTPDPTPEVPSPVTTYRPMSWHWMFETQATRYTPNEDKLVAIAEAAAMKVVAGAFASHTEAMHVPQVESLTADSEAPTPAMHLAAIKADLTLAIENAKSNESPYGVNAAYVGLVAALKVLLHDWPTTA